MQIYKYVIKISNFATMKKITLILLLTSLLFTSCESDFDINADWEEVTVIFGLLDQSQEKQFIRINKAFLGNESAYLMAQEADSLNFNPENLEVKIDKVSSLGNVIDSRILDTTVLHKEEGIFADDNNIIYTFENDDFLKEDKEYFLTITHKNTGKVVTAKTKLIHDLKFNDFFASDNYVLGFVSSFSGDFTTSTVIWDHSRNASIYQLSMKVNYTEYSASDTVVMSVQKDFPLKKHIGDDEYEQQISGESFFEFLSYNIERSDEVNRRVNDVDFYLTAGGGALQTYMNLNVPPTGVVQERPIYTEITNGYGLFSCRLNQSRENVPFTISTKIALADHLDSLNFIYP
tara:strand:- start:1500 stop:2540 length:1041 start_codon:yes stop_codon:yes gene_type:complete